MRGRVELTNGIQVVRPCSNGKYVRDMISIKSLSKAYYMCATSRLPIR